MVDYDLKCVIRNTEENKKKLEEKGLTQYYEESPLWMEWYVGTREIAEEPFNWCNPEHERCPFESFEECQEEEGEIENWLMECPVVGHYYDMYKEVEEAYADLIGKTVGSDVIVIHGNKKDPGDEIPKCFGEPRHSEEFGEMLPSWWDALNEFEEWVFENFRPFLMFGNDDLNGWELSNWNVEEEYKEDILRAITTARENIFGGRGCHFYSDEVEEGIQELQ